MSSDRKTPRPEAEFKLYKRRWVILALFMMFAVNGSVQWIQFPIISDLVVKYYGVSPTQVEWTSTTFMLTYVLLIVPSLCLLDKLGIRNTMIVASIGVTTGTWIKVFSVAPDRFFLAQIGQLFEAIFQILTFGLAARFTAIWFGASEISIAGSLALFGDQFGSALGFYVPSIFVKDGPSEVIGEGLQKMHGLIAVSSTTVLIFITLFFKDRPKLPPSAAQAKQRQIENENVMKTICTILRSSSFLLINLSYGFSVGSFGAITTLLNPIFLMNFPGRTEDVGRIGFVMMLSGMISSLIIGKILDKTRLFKENAIFLTIGSAGTMIAFTWSLKSNNVLYVYLTAVLLGFFIMGYYATGFQMGIEVTYPVSEGISSAIMLLSTQLHGFIFTVACSYAVKTYGDFFYSIFLIITLCLSAIFAIFIPPNLKRQNVEKSLQERRMEEGEELIYKL